MSNVGNLNLEVIYIDLQWQPFISELARELHCCFVKVQLQLLTADRNNNIIKLLEAALSL